MNVVLWRADTAHVGPRPAPARQRCRCGNAIRLVRDPHLGTVAVDEAPVANGPLVVNVDTVAWRRDRDHGFRDRIPTHDLGFVEHRCP